MPDQKIADQQITELEMNINTLDEQIQVLCLERRKLQDQVSAIRAAKDGFKIGCVVLVPWGTPSDKKLRRYEVTNIVYHPYRSGDYKLHGIHIKTDGTKGKNTTDLWQDGITLEKEPPTNEAKSNSAHRRNRR
jgi:chorismate mutase